MVHCKRIEHHGVIRGYVRRVDRSYSVDQHANPISIQASQDGTGGAGNRPENSAKLCVDSQEPLTQCCNQLVIWRRQERRTEMRPRRWGNDQREEDK